MKNIALKTRSAEICKTDLCSTCIHYPDCSFRNLSTASIFFCEEFKLASDWVEAIAKNENLSAAVPARTDPAAEKTDNPELMGLCRNCANRWVCVYPKPPGGVWHCDEYA